MSSATLSPASTASSREAAADRLSDAGRRSKRHTWIFRLDGPGEATCEAVTVELLVSRSGKSQVWIDGKLTFSTRKSCYDFSWEHPSKTCIQLLSEEGNHQLFHKSPRDPVWVLCDDMPTGFTSTTCDSADGMDSYGAEEEHSRHQDVDDDRGRCAGPSQDGLSGERARTAVSGDARNRDPRGTAVPTPSLTAQAQENMRLHALLERKDAEIAALQGQLQVKRTAGQAIPVRVREHLQAAPRARSAVGVPLVPSIDTEDLDVTRRLGPVPVAVPDTHRDRADRAVPVKVEARQSVERAVPVEVHHMWSTPRSRRERLPDHVQPSHVQVVCDRKPVAQRTQTPVRSRASQTPTRARNTTAPPARAWTPSRTPTRARTPVAPAPWSIQVPQAARWVATSAHGNSGGPAAHASPPCAQVHWRGQ